MSAADSRSVTRAVVLARGLGTRMRADDAAVALAPEQDAVADTGLKAMIPVGGPLVGRPFLDYVLSALADAGFADVCLVIGPEHDVVRARYGGGTHGAAPRRVRVHFAVQRHPLGTADAVLAAEAFAGGEPFVVCNGDNYYPPDVLARLRLAGGPAAPAFSRAGLLRDGAIAPARIAGYAVLDAGPDGVLRRIVEKPSAAELEARGPDVRVSMNCWQFPPSIFRACREVAPSPRGELELPLAVQHAVDAHGLRVRLLPVDAPVLDLSRRADVAVVAERLRGVEVRL